ncbi:sensor histidine kinase [Kribbella qitaiheensis]|uniref:histidine kinase n=1 Tax=Kribbella qitaiheensis TaxID=1544730 RepID=A0A7G6X8V4_9ACTN|nr:histidine kinase [Kribbella qitaiheensis]QNE22669.1 sensor histidine kinase [Kribbella qitaiheensis]
MSGIGQRLREADARHPLVLDTAIVAVAFVLFCLPDLVGGDGGPRELDHAFAPLPPAGMLVLQAGLILPLLWRRRAPFVAFAVIALVVLIQWSQSAWLRADIALLIALYSLTLHGQLRSMFVAAGIVVLVLVVVAVRLSAVVSAGEGVFFLVCAVTAATALGLVVRIRRSQLAGLRERAARLEIERDQRAKLAAAGERTRVAREMHDIVGHNLSVMITLADGGAYAAGATPERATEALGLIGDTGRQAMGELRRMLGALREHNDAPELSPQPNIADIDNLCRRTRAAGPSIVYRTTGDVDAMDRGIQLTAYRIVQEALTNTLKHAGPQTQAEVWVNVAESRLQIRVQDSGPPGGPAEPSAGEGHGLVGMKERAAMYGGSVLAGPLPGGGGGWTLEAELDLDPSTNPLEGDR